MGEGKHNVTGEDLLHTLECKGLYLGLLTYYMGGHAVAQLVEALRYKLEGRGFDSACLE